MPNTTTCGVPGNWREPRTQLACLMAKEGLGEGLREGQTFSSALEEFPQTFSPLYVATVRSSEKTSDLAPALGRYVAYAAQLEAIKKRVVNASIYPTLLIAVGGIVSLFLLLYV